MVGVGAGLGDDFHGFREGNALFAQQPDQLGNHHAGMGVVDLDGRVVRQVVVIAAPGGAFLQNQLGTGGNHQVLLIDPQLTACLVGVVGVQEQGQVFVDGGLVKGDAVVYNAFIHGVNIEQVQGVGAALVAGDRQPVKPGGVGFAPQGNGVGGVRLFRPAVGAEPGVGLLLLHAAGEGLTEQAEMIPQAHAVTGQVQGGQGIQEAGCQTAQAAVAQRGLRFHLFDVGKLLSRGKQGSAHLVIEAQIDQIVGQQLANQEFGADIVQLPALCGANLLSGFLLYQPQQGKVKLGIGAFTQGFPRQSGERVCHGHKRVPPFLSV